MTSWHLSISLQMLQNVGLSGRNTTGPPCNVGRPTVHAPGSRPARPPAGSVTNDDDDDRTGPLGGPVIIKYE